MDTGELRFEGTQRRYRATHNGAEVAFSDVIERHPEYHDLVRR